MCGAGPHLHRQHSDATDRCPSTNSLLRHTVSALRPLPRRSTSKFAVPHRIRQAPRQLQGPVDRPRHRPRLSPSITHRIDCTVEPTSHRDSPAPRHSSSEWTGACPQSGPAAATATTKREPDPLALEVARMTLRNAIRESMSRYSREVRYRFCSFFV